MLQCRYVLCFAVLCIVSNFSIISLGAERAGYLTFVVLNVMSLLSFFDSSSWSEVCECGICWSYSLTFRWKNEDLDADLPDSL